MTQKTALKTIILAVVFLLLITVLALLPNLEKDYLIASSIKNADEPIAPQLVEDFSNASVGDIPCAFARNALTYQTLAGYGDWEIKPLFDGNAAYFGVDADFEEFYSASAYLTTPRLNLSDNDYKISIDYFSERTSDFPNFLTIYSSHDGNKYQKLHTEKVFFTDNTFKRIELDLPKNFKFLRFEAKAYADGGSESGIYIDNIGLAAQNSYDLSTVTFSVETDPQQELVFDGEEKVPSFTLAASVEDAQYYYHSFVTYGAEPDFSQEISAISAGNYYLHVAVFDIQNNIVDVFSQAFEIQKADLTVDMTELNYLVYDSWAFIYNLPLFDLNGKEVTEIEVSEIEYVKEIDSVPTYFTMPAISTASEEIFSFYFRISGGNNYNDYISESITMGETRFSGEFFFINTEQTIEYTGEELAIDYTFFTIIDNDINNTTVIDPPQENFTITYTQNDVVVPPINPGEYTATFTYNTASFAVLFTISPKSILYADYIGLSLDKAYDGSDMLIYNHKINPDDTDFVTASSETILPHDFGMTSVAAGDDVFLNVSKARYSFNYGRVKVMLEGVTLGGTDSYKYVLDRNFTTYFDNTYYTISPTMLSLAPHTDNSNVLLIKEKTYDGYLNAQIDFEALETIYGDLSLCPIKFFGLAGEDNIDITTLSVTFKDPYAGQMPVDLYLNDDTLMDRYYNQISLSKLSTPLVGTILPKELEIDIDASDIVLSQKTYSGTTSADVIINHCTFNTPLSSDNTAINGIGQVTYKIVFDSATFSQPNVGSDLEVTVSGIDFSLITTQYSHILRSYTIKDLVLVGDILPQELTVKSEHIRITESSFIPEISILPLGININSTYYLSQSDAQNMTNPLFSPPSTAGTYYIRVASIDNNYYIDGGYSIVTLVIVPASQKTDQNIVFEDLDDYITGNAITIIKGGKFLPNAVSYTSTNERTNLTVSYSVTGTSSLFTFVGGVFTALDEGTVNIVAAQSGNEYFNAATSSIAVNIVEFDLDLQNVSPLSTAYVCDSLPMLSGSVLVDSIPYTASFSALDEKAEYQKNSYAYSIVFNDTYAGIYDIDFAITPQRAKLNVIIPNTISREYYHETNFLEIVTLQIEKNSAVYPIAISEYSSYDLEFLLDYDELNLVPNAYTVSLLGSGEYNLSVTSNENYQVVPSRDNFILNVNKSSLLIKTPSFTKHYGEQNPTPIASSVVIEGNFLSEDLTTLRSSMNFTVYCGLRSPVGSYPISTYFSFDDPSIEEKYNFVPIEGYLTVLPNPITISTTAAFSVYKAPLSQYVITIIGLNLLEDYQYLSSYVSSSLIGVTSLSNAGTYTILIDYFGSDINYDITVISGVYTITPASFSGIYLNDGSFLYDGKKHNLDLTYQQETWPDISIVYNMRDVIEVGVYNVTATVSLPNYTSQVYSAKLTINSLSLVTSSTTNKAEITDIAETPQGFSPDITLTMVTSQKQGITEEVTAMLKSYDTLQENILGIYDITLLQNNSPLPVENKPYRVKITISGVTSPTNIRILASVDNALTEIEYTFENGAFIFETDSLSGIAVLKTTQITESRLGTIVVASIFGLIVILMLYVIVSTSMGNKKAKLRSRKRHHKWS